MNIQAMQQRICEIEELLACKDRTVHEADDLRNELYELSDDLRIATEEQ